MNVLFIGDIIGRPGREAVKGLLPVIVKEEKVNIVIANGENAAGGFGLTPSVAGEIFSLGVNVITLGNHAWKRKEILEVIDNNHIIRPANFPPGVPGKGYIIMNSNEIKLAVINLMGRVYMADTDCPFRKSDEILEELRDEKIRNIIVDFHAEITSEKIAFGWYLDGKVSAVVGTHTHVQTADERVMPQGTAYITDAGMTGARDSVIGVKKEIILKKYLTQMPIRFEVAEGDPALSAVIIDIDESTGKARGIRRINRPFMKPGN